MSDLAGLKPFATARQIEFIEAAIIHGSLRQAALALGAAPQTVIESIKRLRARAAVKGYAPEAALVNPVPDPFVVKGYSTYYNKEGKPAQQWVKTRLDNNQLEAVVQSAVAALAESVTGLAPLTACPEFVDSDLLAVYPLGDPHFGMYAWSKECGESFDLAIAKHLTLGAIDRLMNSAPNTETAIILPLGDVFHADDQSNRTPAHGNQLDVDSRYVKVLGVGVEAFRHAVVRALEKHKTVIVRFVAGNHDPHSVWALAFTISAYFSSEPRVTVDLSPSLFWYYRFGKVLLGSTHGDTAKHEALLGIMATDRDEDWGATKHRYWYTGHVHHSALKEFPGVVCESFRTLAAKDAYAAGHGYRAGRDMRCIIHHREHGEIERHRCDVGMILQPKEMDFAWQDVTT